MNDNYRLEIAEASANFADTIIRIADKYEKNRTDAIRLVATTFLQSAYQFTFDNYKFKEETNNE